MNNKPQPDNEYENVKENINKRQQMSSNRLMFSYNILVRKLLSLRWMSVPEVCSHEIVCVEDSVAPVASGEEGAADVGGCW